MFALITVIILLSFIVLVILNLPVFGNNPTGLRLAQIKALTNYKSDAIQNLTHTPNFPPGVTYWKVINAMIKGNANAIPPKELPHAQPDFTSSNDLKITWFGHSSYLLQVEDVNILVDPIFSQTPSPFQFLGSKAFAGTNFIEVEDLPDIDVLLLTHDHYDHLDYATILKLKGKFKQIVTSLGVGAHLAHWGINNSLIKELRWGERFNFSAEISFTAAPARHFSGRKFKRNLTLWSSFILQTDKLNLYLGGDSGYDTHFKAIGEQYGPFDLVLLECGQYNEMWPLIHLFPEEGIQAAIDLKAKRLMPIHWGKFKLALHDWDDPIKRITKKAAEMQMIVITPKLGESFILNDNYESKKWWEVL